MDQTLRNDQQNRKQLLETAVREANAFLDNLPTQPAAINPGTRHFENAWHHKFDFLSAVQFTVH